MLGEEDYLFGEPVIGSYYNYHREFCHVIKNIPRANKKKLCNWQEAVALGLEPSKLCNPCYIKPNEPRIIGF